MIGHILLRDAGYRLWLAARPGLWLEVGVFDEAAVLVTLMAERRSLGLPRLASLRVARRVRARHRARRVGKMERQQVVEVRA